jgi:DNA-binding response OmpR family regulator
MKTKSKTEKKRILVVDDLASDTRLLKRYLECHDYVVLEENDPKSALLTAEKFEPNLILLDLIMPGMDGREVAGCLQASPKLKAVPIVFLTASITKEEVKVVGGRIGRFPFLAKPIQLGEVVACLKQHLGD